jgi:hypothetical protein
MRVDYHLHPNLQAKSTARRLRALWSAIDTHRLDAVVCAEHTFKNAPNAYRQLKRSQPKDSRTHVFPGAELTTSDGWGIDVIAFADHDWYDQHPRLLEPFSMPLREMLSYLEQSDLQYFIPHPFIFKNPLQDLYGTDEEMKAFLQTVPAYEGFNACCLAIESVLRSRPLRKPCARVRANVRAHCQPKKELLPERSWQFIAVGSDAHHPGDVGFSVEIPCPAPRSRIEAFRRITQNTDISRLHAPPMRGALGKMIRGTWTTASEGAIRRYAKLRLALHSIRESEEESVLMTDVELATEQAFGADAEDAGNEA